MQAEIKNYKLEKQLKYAAQDEEVEVIQNYAKGHSKHHMLPVEQYSKEILYTIENSDITIIMGETGSGKTTKIPEYLYKQTNIKYRIAHILPRKIATISVA